LTDLKPDNVMLVGDLEVAGGERVKILDFGIAKVITEYSGPGAEEFKTSTGLVLGTATYMAPEQCKGAGDVTEKADVYSLGIVMYRMCSGKVPYGHAHLFATPTAARGGTPDSRTTGGACASDDVEGAARTTNDGAGGSRTGKDGSGGLESSGGSKIHRVLCGSGSEIHGALCRGGGLQARFFECSDG
jgi:serine/threonine protein kinase